MEDRIRSFLEETFLFEFGDEIAGDTDLFKAGVMDSFGYVQLVGFLKTEFGIAFTDEEMLTDILVSFDRIVAFVRLRRGR
jgi:acyl carrier protein